MLQTQDRFPARVFAGYEDSGDIETGIDRYFAGFNYGDLFGLGQQFNYQYTTSGNFDSLRAHSGSYVIPLPWEHTLTFFGSYVDTKGHVARALRRRRAAATRSAAGTASRCPRSRCPRSPTSTASTAGFDYKYNNNSLEFGNAPAAGTLYEVDQFVLGYNGAESDPGAAPRSTRISTSAPAA